MPDQPATVGEQLAIISTKLDVLIEQRVDHESRLRRLETFRWVLLGAALAAGPAWDRIATAAGVNT